MRALYKCFLASIGSSKNSLCGDSVLDSVYPSPPKGTGNALALPVPFGGDGGNRNRVRKFAHTTFYMLSLCFGIPFSYRSQTN